MGITLTSERPAIRNVSALSSPFLPLFARTHRGGLGGLGPSEASLPSSPPARPFLSIRMLGSFAHEEEATTRVLHLYHSVLPEKVSAADKAQQPFSDVYRASARHQQPLSPSLVTLSNAARPIFWVVCSSFLSGQSISWVVVGRSSLRNRKYCGEKALPFRG